MMQLNC